MLKTFAATIFACVTAVSLSAQTPAPVKTVKVPPAKPVAVAKPMVKKDTPASLRKEAKISLKDARATALKEVPNGKVRKSELERENGKLVYSFNIKLAGKSGSEEVTVDAITGAVVTHEHETPKAAKTEEKKEKK